MLMLWMVAGECMSDERITRRYMMTSYQTIQHKPSKTNPLTGKALIYNIWMGSTLLWTHVGPMLFNFSGNPVQVPKSNIGKITMLVQCLSFLFLAPSGAQVVTMSVLSTAPRECLGLQGYCDCVSPSPIPLELGWGLGT